MDPRERLLSTLFHREHDKVPLDIFSFNGYSTPTVIGLKGSQVYPEAYACPDDPGRKRISELLADKIAVQYPVSSGVNRYMAIPPQRIKEELIEENEKHILVKQIIDTPKGKLEAVLERRADSIDNIWTLEYPIKELSDLEKLASVPCEIPQNMDVITPETYNEVISDRKSVVYSYISSPFVCVGGAMSYEDFLFACAAEPDLIGECVDICKTRIHAIADELLAERCLDVVWIGGSEWLTPPMSSPDLYRQFVVEPEKEIIEKVHEHGGLVHVHSHGNVASPIIDMVIERGADYFEPVEAPPDGNIVFSDAKEIADHNLVLGGNIELSLMENGTTDEVRAAVERAFEGNKGNMVLAISAPTNRPRIHSQFEQNIHMLVSTWERMGDIE